MNQLVHGYGGMGLKKGHQVNNGGRRFVSDDIFKTN